MLRSFDEGLSWKSAYDPISKADIFKVEDTGLIYLKEPNSCWYEEIRLSDVSGGSESDNATGGGIQVMRPVYVPKVADAILNYSQGYHYVSSRKNFVFTIQPTGHNIGKELVVKTNRTTIPDSEGVLMEKDENGVYTVTILSIQGPIELAVDFATGNGLVENGKVWATSGQLHILSTTTAEAQIYNAAGVLFKTASLIPGETDITSLSRGLYMVKMNGQTYKVIVK